MGNHHAAFKSTEPSPRTSEPKYIRSISWEEEPFDHHWSQDQEEELLPEALGLINCRFLRVCVNRLPTDKEANASHARSAAGVNTDVLSDKLLLPPRVTWIPESYLLDGSVSCLEEVVAFS